LKVVCFATLVTPGLLGLLNCCRLLRNHHAATPPVIQPQLSFSHRRIYSHNFITANNSFNVRVAHFTTSSVSQPILPAEESRSTFHFPA